MDLSEDIYVWDVAICGDAGPLFVTAVGEFAGGVEPEVTGAGVFSGEEGAVFVWGEGSGYWIEEELVDGVGPGVRDEDGAAIWGGGDAVCSFIGGDELSGFGGEGAIFFDAMDGDFSGLVVGAEEELTGGVDGEERGGGSDLGFAELGEFSFGVDVVGDDGVGPFEGDVESRLVLVDGHARGAAFGFDAALEGEGSFVEGVGVDFFVLSEGEDDDLLGSNDWVDDDVSIGDRSMISLEKKVSRGSHIGVKSAVGVSKNGLVIDDLFTVENDGGVAVDDGDIISLPLSSGFSGVVRCFDAVENRADSVDALHLAVAVHDLNFIEATDVNPTVSSRGNIEFESESAVSERLLGPEVSVAGEGIKILFGRFVNEDAITGFPAVLLVGVGEGPAGEVFAIEERDRLSKFHL